MVPHVAFEPLQQAAREEVAGGWLADLFSAQECQFAAERFDQACRLFETHLAWPLRDLRPRNNDPRQLWRLFEINRFLLQMT